MRIWVGFLVVCILGLAPDSTRAVELDVINSQGNEITLDVGQSVDVEVMMTNLSLTTVHGLGVSVHGYDEGVADFVSGQSVQDFFNSSCSGAGICIGGLDQVNNAYFDPANLVETEIGTNGRRVQIFLSASLTAVSNPGAGIDVGLDGNVGTAMSRVRFRALGLGSTTLRIDTFYEGDGVVGVGGALSHAVGSAFTIHVVPEPGILVLLGLGMAALAAGRPARRASLQ